jgi:hypothetical protein
MGTFFAFFREGLAGWLCDVTPTRWHGPAPPTRLGQDRAEALLSLHQAQGGQRVDGEAGAARSAAAAQPNPLPTTPRQRAAECVGVHRVWVWRCKVDGPLPSLRCVRWRRV